MELLFEKLATDYVMSALLLAGYINLWRAWAVERKANRDLLMTLIRKVGDFAEALETVTGEKDTD